MTDKRPCSADRRVGLVEPTREQLAQRSGVRLLSAEAITARCCQLSGKVQNQRNQTANHINELAQRA